MDKVTWNEKSGRRQQTGLGSTGRHVPPPPAGGCSVLVAPMSSLPTASLHSMFISQQRCVSQVAVNRNKIVGVEMALDLQKKAPHKSNSLSLIK